MLIVACWIQINIATRTCWCVWRSLTLHGSCISRNHVCTHPYPYYNDVRVLHQVHWGYTAVHPGCLDSYLIVCYYSLWQVLYDLSAHISSEWMISMLLIRSLTNTSFIAAYQSYNIVCYYSNIIIAHTISEWVMRMYLYKVSEGKQTRPLLLLIYQSYLIVWICYYINIMVCGCT